MARVNIDESWFEYLSPEFDSDYMKNLSIFLKKEKSLQKVIYPRSDKIFNAFNLTPFGKVKVVILGQDPYHGESQANGLSFSVSPSVTIPPSLRNIFKELYQDLKIRSETSGCLEHWAKQGVLLLNTCLTVEKGKPASHRNKGWERFTDATLNALNQNKKNLVYILWGIHAKEKASLINHKQNLILVSPHPSPYSASHGFFGSKPFSKTNSYLQAHGQRIIQW
jgi:uracil-DNA glycosylase